MKYSALKKDILKAIWLNKLKIQQTKPPKDLLNWLEDKGSLTERLLLFCNQQFRVEVLNENQEKITNSEAGILKQEVASFANIREVFLFCKNEPVVFARTIIPKTTLTGKQKELLNLKNKPLGAFLFAQKDMQRGPINITCIKHDSNQIWGRSSVFYLAKKPLLVEEFFLPNLLK